MQTISIETTGYRPHRFVEFGKVRRYLPHLIEIVWERKINPGKVFDLVLPLDQAAEGYRAIVGPRDVEQLTGSLRALEISLSDETLRRLDEIWRGPGGEPPEAYAW